MSIFNTAESFIALHLFSVYSILKSEFIKHKNCSDLFSSNINKVKLFVAV